MVWSERVRLVHSVSAWLVLERLREKITKLQEIEKQLTLLSSIIREKGGEIELEDEEKLIDTINELCAEFGNCMICPAQYNCDLGMGRTCDDMQCCSSCPKLRECFREWVSKWS
jgi:hypothetical protein